MEEKTYTLRYAAGSYWLFRVPRTGDAYRPPLQLNRMGADIIKLAGQGFQIEQIVQKLCQVYDAQDEESRSLIQRDVAEFLRLLEEHDIRGVGEKGVNIL